MMLPATIHVSLDISISDAMAKRALAQERLRFFTLSFRDAYQHAAAHLKHMLELPPHHLNAQAYWASIAGALIPRLLFLKTEASDEEHEDLDSMFKPSGMTPEAETMTFLARNYRIYEGNPLERCLHNSQVHSVCSRRYMVHHFTATLFPGGSSLWRATLGCVMACYAAPLLSNKPTSLSIPPGKGKCARGQPAR